VGGDGDVIVGGDGNVMMGCMGGYGDMMVE